MRESLSADNYRLEDRGYKTLCWIWQGATRGDYGIITVFRNRKTTVQAHQYYYLQSGKTIPDGMILDHLCDQRTCVNPEHLEPKTHAKNIRRAQKSYYN